MGENSVSLVRCGGYGGEAARAVAEAIGLLGGVREFVGPGQSVFVKVNAVTASPPESGRVTHPDVTRAVIEEIMKVTDSVTVGDSPGGPFSAAFLKRVYDRTGLAAVAERTGARLSLDTRTVDVRFPEGRSLKRLMLCASMLEADVLVSISKFKAHRYLNVTGPVKNLYGAVPGTTKFVYHSRFDYERAFADLVVDVHLAAGASFHVVDAVEVMEGEGARMGDVRRMGVIAAGSNAFALEAMMLDLAGLDQGDSRVLSAAVERGTCPPGTGWYEVLGDRVDALKLDGFHLPSRNYFSERTPAMVAERLHRFVAVTPEPLAGRCTMCGDCVSVCPRGAVSMGADAAVVDSRRCIRCFCCDELCIHDAIVMRRPLLMRLARRGRAGRA